MSEEDDSDGFLSRWSRMKKEARADDASPGKAARPGGDRVRAREASQAGPPPKPDEETADLAKLPKIDDLTAETDITAFLRKGVPEELKRLALRKAWALDPSIRDFVEVAENQYDWNVPGGVPGFGDLVPGTDIEALLAQATGALPAEPVAPEGSKPLAAGTTSERAGHMPVVGGEPPTQPAAAGSDGDDRPPAPDSEESPAPGSIASDVSGTSDHEELNVAPHRPRRRHGGALPG